MDITITGPPRLLRCSVCHAPIRLTQEQFMNWDADALKACVFCFGDNRE